MTCNVLMGTVNPTHSLTQPSYSVLPGSGQIDAVIGQERINWGYTKMIEQRSHDAPYTVKAQGQKFKGKGHKLWLVVVVLIGYLLNCLCNELSTMQHRITSCYLRSSVSSLPSLQWSHDPELEPRRRRRRRVAGQASD